MSKKILITGVNGFLGKYFVEEARKRNFQIWGIDKFGSPNPYVYRFIQEDIDSNRGAEFVLSSKPSLCVHLAGSSSVIDSFKNPDIDFRNGPLSLFSLLNVLKCLESKCALAFISSAAVYGEPKKLPIKEEDALQPISPYGYHKLQSEILLREFNQIFNIPTLGFRVFSAYGEGQKKQVLWDMCKQLILYKSLDLQGTGSESRDFIHASDIARAVFLAFDSAKFDGSLYNLGSGTETSIYELSRLVVSSLGESIEPQFNGIVRTGNPLNWCADITKLMQLGFAINQSLEVGVKNYVQWCQHQLNN